jgi:hypothetical protein
MYNLTKTKDGKAILCGDIHEGSSHSKLSKDGKAILSGSSE